MSDLIGNKRKREYECDCCDYKCKDKCSLKHHKANIHEINITWYQCDCCDDKFKENETFRTFCKILGPACRGYFSSLKLMPAGKGPHYTQILR